MERSTIPVLFLTALVASAAGAEDEVARDRVGFQVESAREVPNDWAVARLTVLSEGRDASIVADEVNRVMATAVARAKDSPGIEVITGSYSTQPVYNDRRIVRWRAYQELRLQTADVGALSELIGDLQGQGVTLAGIDFSVAKATRRALEDELIAEALVSFQARAQKIASAMGRKAWSLIGLTIGHHGLAPPPFPMRQDRVLSSMSAAPPTLEGGTSEVRVVVEGTIEIE